MIDRTATGIGVSVDELPSELADNTKTAYQKGWKKFIDFCAAGDITDPLAASPSDVVNFLVQLATQANPQSGVTPSMGTVLLYKSAVNKKYLAAGQSSPTGHPSVQSTLKGLARLKGSSPRQVEAFREFHITAMLKSCPTSLIGKRDAAIIALGFAGALRRSEICGLMVEDVEFIDPTATEAPRIWLTIQHSKTDQHGRGQKIAIVDGQGIRPIEHLHSWLDAAGISKGPLFQSMRRGGHLRGNPMHHSDVPRILKYYATKIGLDPKNIAGHSLRAGFVTSAAVHNARLDKIMAVTRHTDPATVLRYIRDADAFTDHAGQHFL